MKTAILAILLFCALIFPHELGHFLVAKLCHVQVNEFALGMGPAIFKKQKGETLYALRAIPIGGYCAMEGENEESENPRAFNNKKAWQKILVLVAGSLMNVIICVVIMIFISGSVGTTTNVIDEVTTDMPAYGIIQPGDEIIGIDGQKVETWDDFGVELQKAYVKKSEAVRITLIREGEEKTFTVKTKLLDDEKRAVIGVVCKLDHGVFSSIKGGWQSTKNMSVQMYNAIKMLTTKEAGIKDLSGPVGIISAVNQTKDYGITYFFYLMAFISLNLAFVNMLPLPALDGGRILFVIIRKITGKMISDELEGIIHTVGLFLLLGLMVYVTWNDIGRLL